MISLFGGNPRSAPRPANSPLKVLFWTTTFQADTQSLARRLCNDPRFVVLVALHEPDRYRAEPVAQLLPLSCQLLDRDARATVQAIDAFAPDITIVDNHFPPKAFAPRLFVLWHGFGWKGPNDRAEFAEVHKSIARLTGAPADAPNPHFVWQCFGPTDLEHRHGVSGFARENLQSLGSAFTDDLVAPPVTRMQARTALPAAFADKPVVLLAFTWHYGRVFSHWGEDEVLFARLFAHISARGAATVLRLHDRHRYEPDYLAALEGFAACRDGVQLKYKDRDRDSLLDLLAADVMVSNYSSILNFFYATGRPSIHVYPVAPDAEGFLWRTFKRGKVRVTEIPSADYIWKLPPEEHGGLLVRDFDGLLAAIDTALADPNCCVETANAFNQKHLAPVDGQTGARIAEALLALGAVPA